MFVGIFLFGLFFHMRVVAVTQNLVRCHFAVSMACENLNNTFPTGQCNPEL